MVEKFPHIKDYVSMSIPPGVNIAELLKCQLALAIKSGDKLLYDNMTMLVPNKWGE